MSDNEDAHSEAPPEGWSSMFNKTVAGKSDSKAGTTKTKETPATTNWFGGLFESNEAKSKKSSISSDTPPEPNSEKPSAGEEDERSKWDAKQGSDRESENGSGSPDSDEVDSDGFPINETKVKMKNNISDLDDDEAPQEDGVIIDGEGPESPFPVDETNDEISRTVRPSSPRRERIRNNMNFLVSHEAAELVEAEAQDPSSTNTKDTNGNPVPKTPLPAPEKGSDVSNNPAVRESSTSNTEALIPWWQTIFAGAAVTSQDQPQETKPSADKKQPVEQKNEDRIQQEDGSKPKEGLWNSLFGSNGPKEESPAILLPEIPAPPELPVLNEVNSFFTRPPVSDPQLDLLAPGPVTRYEGRLRGWPRRLAPQWSSHQRGAERVFSSYPNTQIDGVSALAMFRVT